MVKKYFFIILIVINSIFLYSQINNENIKQISTISDETENKDINDEHIEEKVQYNPQDHFVRNLKLKKIAENKSECFILDRKNKNTLGHFSIIKETTTTRDSFNNAILATMYYVKDHALEPIAGRADQREVGTLVTYYNKYLSTLGGTVSTAIIESILVAGSIGAIVSSIVLFTVNNGNDISNYPSIFNDNLFSGKILLPLFVGGVAALGYALLFAPAVIVTAVFCARNYNNYIALKKSVIDSLNNIKTPITIKDNEGTPLVKIGFDLRVNVTNYF